MGHLLRPTSSGLVIERIAEDGCHIHFGPADAPELGDLCKLMLDEASPLTPRASRYARPSRSLRGPPPPERLLLEPGVWWVRRAHTPAEEYLVVAHDGPRLVSKPEAYCLLGALEVLHELGLDDAAVSLKAGDFERASVQVIEELERRKR